MKRIIYIISSLLFLYSCSTGRVIHFTNSEANFSTYSNYKFRNAVKDSISAEGMQIANAIQNSIKMEMKNRGYIQGSVGADLQLHYDLISSYSDNFNNNPNRNSRFFNNDPFFYNNNWQSTDVYKSVLLIELYDIKKKKLVWQASMDLSHARREKRREIMIARAVERIFSTYQKTANQNN